MTLEKFAEKYIEELDAAQLDYPIYAMERAAQEIKSCPGTVWLCGNGGSAALASHMATDLQLARVRAIALTDIAAVTTYGNDFGYNQCFSRQIEVLSKPEDILIVISGSGSSKNIYDAVKTAEFRGIITIGLFGHNGKRAPHVDILLPIASARMPIIQDVQQSILHIISYWLAENK